LPDSKARLHTEKLRTNTNKSSCSLSPKRDNKIRIEEWEKTSEQNSFRSTEFKPSNSSPSWFPGVWC